MPIKTGDMVKVRVLEVDPEKERVGLGIKQLTEDRFEAASKGVKKGDVVTATVLAVRDNGLDVQLSDGTTGFIRRADLSRDRSEQRPDRFAIGEKVDGLVTTVDKKERKIFLSIKQRELEEDKQAMAQFGSSDSGASLGDILGAAMEKKSKKGKDADE